MPPLTVGGVAELAQRAGSHGRRRRAARPDAWQRVLRHRVARRRGRRPAGDGERRRAGPRRATLADGAGCRGRRRDARHRRGCRAARAPSSGRELEAVDECVEAGVLVADGHGVRLPARARSRVPSSASLSAVRRRQLHRRALRALRADARGPPHPRPPRRRVRRRCGRAHTTPCSPRERAARLGAHREAAAQYRIALRHGSGGRPTAPHCSSRSRTSAISPTSCPRRSLLASGRSSCTNSPATPACVGRRRALALAAVVVPRPRRGCRALRRPRDREPRTPRRQPGAGDGVQQLRAAANARGRRRRGRDVGAKSARTRHPARRPRDRVARPEQPRHRHRQAGRCGQGEAHLVRSLDLALAGRPVTNMPPGRTRTSAANAGRRATATPSGLGISMRASPTARIATSTRGCGTCRPGAASCSATSVDSTMRSSAAVALLDHPDISPISAIPAAAAAARVSRHAEAAMRRGVPLDRDRPRGGHRRAAAHRTGSVRGRRRCLAARRDRRASPRLTDAAWHLAVAHDRPDGRPESSHGGGCSAGVAVLHRTCGSPSRSGSRSSARHCSPRRTRGTSSAARYGRRTRARSPRMRHPPTAPCARSTHSGATRAVEAVLRTRARARPATAPRPRAAARAHAGPAHRARARGAAPARPRPVDGRDRRRSSSSRRAPSIITSRLCCASSTSRRAPAPSPPRVSSARSTPEPSQHRAPGR